MVQEERTMKSEKIYDGKMVSLRVDTVEMNGAKYSKREIVSHAPAVCIIAENENGEILFIEQFRKAVEKKIYELPAGIIEMGEEPIDAARREFSEETGWEAKDMEYLTEFYTSPGFTNEKIHLFYAKNFIRVGQHLDEDENIDNFAVTLEKALKMIEVGDISDAKSIIGVLFYKEFKQHESKEINRIYSEEN